MLLDIFDASGSRVIRLVEGIRESGSHQEEWSGCNSSGTAATSGVYFYRLTAGKHTLTRKMVLAR
ncbi:MAG: T9SS type A sorting domain-containing protein [Candidatus Krumholzibacteriota bacterium]|nr:T9SS type A sorting domain-containing protein [Candidatus Krumholzibacteriota bacterium]